MDFKSLSRISEIKSSYEMNLGYRMFSEWLVEAYYLRTFLQLSHVPHFTTLQKFTERISVTLLKKIISSFIILTKIGQLFIGIDSSGFKATPAFQYVEIKPLRKMALKHGWPCSIANYSISFCGLYRLLCFCFLNHS